MLILLPSEAFNRVNRDVQGLAQLVIQSISDGEGVESLQNFYVHWLVYPRNSRFFTRCCVCKALARDCKKQKVKLKAIVFSKQTQKIVSRIEQ